MTSPELQKLLTPSMTVDVAYVTSSNTMRAKEDIVANTRFTKAFNSLNLGSDGVACDIPNKSLIGQMIVFMEFPELADNIFLPRGWGYSCIDRIESSIGGASPQIFNGESLLALAMLQCETNEKRDQLLRVAGDEVNGPNQGKNVACIHIPLPYSTIRYLGRKLPYDSSLINSPIRVTLYFKQANQLFSGSNAENAPSAFTRGFFQLRQFDFKDQSQSLKMTMSRDSSLFYSYPYFYVQSYAVAPFVGSSDRSSPVVVNLLGFRAGNLQSITLQLKEVETGTTAIKNLNQYEMMSNIVLDWNGQTLVRSDDNTEMIWCLESGLTECAFNNSVVPTTNLNAPFTSYPVKSFMPQLVLSQFNPVSQGNLLQSGYNVGSQTLVLSFTTPKDGAVYRLNVSYNYLATVLTKESNAEITF
jgi:hypothetical protein